MNYKRINVYLGWLVFILASIVYITTIEDTVSLWDCGEYITAAYKLEVGHPPGAPFFMLLGRLFSFFASPENVAVWINTLSAFSSSATVLFMFWSLTMIIKRISLLDKKELSKGDQIAIFGGAFVGAMAYTFTESFWFSAVEGEVYAMASLFTAIIFWAILKWDEEMQELQSGGLFIGYSPDRWLLLIMFLLGLAIGVHLLGILTVPAIAYVIYFRYQKEVTPKMFIWVGILSIIVLGFIQVGVISGSIAIASYFEIMFKKTLGLPFYSGTIFFFIALIAGAYFVLRYARRKNKKILYTATMGLILLLIGYGSFAVIVIRSNANTPLDENDPENLVTLQSYLKREQYGTAPILYGPYWNSKEADRSQWKDMSPIYLRRFIVEKNGAILKAFKDQKRAEEYAKKHGAEIREDYFESNAGIRKNALPTYSQNTIFPRMYMNNDPNRIKGYKMWSGYDANDGTGTEIGKDGKRLPSFSENLTFFTRYQLNWMYWRYFMWNFAGRQNDIQNTDGNSINGNWLSGFGAIDNIRLGNQDEAPYFTAENPSNNKFFLLPLILGIIGLFFHVYRDPRFAFVIFLAFLFMGVAIIVYLNPKPLEPRERDYAYAGSFYFFAMWIGVGVYVLYEAFKAFSKKELIGAVKIALAGLLLMLVFDLSGSEVSVPSTMAWLYITIISFIVIGLMYGLRKIIKGDTGGAIAASIIGLTVPVIMGIQGWDDHDRSLKTSARDLAYNYLVGMGKNGILYTNGDNDTFPLWYMQEVEGFRTDVRVANLSLMQTDWYTDQMKLKTYESDPLPILFTEDQILMYSGKTDQVLFLDLYSLFMTSAPDEVIEKAIDVRVKTSKENKKMAIAKVNELAVKGGQILNSASSDDARVVKFLNQSRQLVSIPYDSTKSIAKQIRVKTKALLSVLGASQGANSLIKLNENAIQELGGMLQGLDRGWSFVDLKLAMEFTRNDDNLIDFGNGQKGRIFPTKDFILPVNVENAIASGVITKDQADKCLKELRFSFDKSGLTREQVMMLDVFANNDWKRHIAFSSPGGSDVALALYRRGYVKQTGLIFEVSPLDAYEERMNNEKMYQNLMEVYRYGQMNNPDVLTDYYTRRHTSQYRLHFLTLAEDYLRKSIQAEETNKRLSMYKSSNMPLPANMPEARSEKEIKKMKERSIKLLKRSLEVMPAEIVIDYGEPTASYRDTYNVEGKTLPGYDDGILHDYVQLLYASGDIETAEKLGKIVASQLESIINHFEKSDIRIASNPKNTKFLYAAISNYFKLFSGANDQEMGNPDGKLAKRTQKMIRHIYSEMFPNMFDQLEEIARENNEIVRRGMQTGYYASRLFDLQDYAKGIAQQYGMIDGGNEKGE